MQSPIIFFSFFITVCLDFYFFQIIYHFSDDDHKPQPDSEEDAAARMRLKRKLQRNRTSFTQEQIENLERGLILSKTMTN